MTALASAKAKPTPTSAPMPLEESAAMGEEWQGALRAPWEQRCCAAAPNANADHALRK
jgi:hypothetical protein